jgi:hypothetical protein
MNKIIPILAILGGGYLLLKSKSNSPIKNDSQPTPIDVPINIDPVFNPTSNTNYSSTNESNVGSLDNFDYETIGWNTWKGKDWSNWFKQFQLSYNDKFKAFEDAFVIWRNPLNPYRNFFIEIKQFVLALAIADSYNPSLPRNVIGQFNITYNSTPVYDTYTNWWYNVPVWNCAEWKQWYIELKNYYGENDARYRWNSAAQHPDNGYGGNFADCQSDCDFYKFQVQNNLWRPFMPITAAYTWAACDIGQVITGATNAAVGVSQGLVNTSRVISIALPVLAIAGTYFIYKKYLKNGKK